MLLSLLCAGAAALALCCGWLRHDRPLDAQERRILQRFAEELRREQIHPFE